MSDTDDTDALLTCDPGGGLHSLLGKTMDEISTSQMDSNSGETSSSATIKKSNNPPAPVSSTSTNTNDESLLNESKNSNDKDTTTTTSINVSDYFNSDGELVLPDVSQFLENNTPNGMNDNNSKNVKTGGSSGDSADCSSSDHSTASTATVESNTVVPSSSKSRVTEKTNACNDINCHKILNDKKTAGHHKLRTSLVKRDKKNVPKEIQNELTKQLLLANKNNPEAQRIIDHNSSHISYGVLNLNLNDLKNFAEGMSLCDLLPSSPKVNVYEPRRNDQGEQIFVRAPNFRTPGGYKPSANPRKCRDLTDEQITEEVRKMYAYPDDSDTPDENTGSTEKANLESSALEKDGKAKQDCEEKAASEKVKVDFNFLDGTPVPNEFGKGKSGKSIKRKMLPNGGNICGGTVGSIPDLGFGLRSLSSDEVQEPLVERKVAWTTGRTNELSGKENTGSSALNISTGTSTSTTGFSFGFGEADTYSPIKPMDANTGHRKSLQEDLNLFQSQRLQPSPDKNLLAGMKNDSKQENDKEIQCAIVGNELNVTEKLKVERKEGGETPTTSKRSPLAAPKTKLSTPRRRLIREAASKLRGLTVTSPMASSDIVGCFSSHSASSVASDLAEILREIDIPSDELESLIDNLDDTDLPEAVGFLGGVDSVDANLVDALSHLKLDNWRNDDHTFTEKYHNERVKREQCERELRNLQENFLSEKQQNAVLEGTLKRRNAMLVQITVAFNRVCKEWSKLQRDQKILAVACKNSRERISHYEKELHDTLEMAEAFKIKINDVQKERDESIIVLKETNNELEGKIVKLKENMELLRNERDATLRALREAQIKLDEDRFTFENMEAQLKILEDRDIENVQKYQELLQAKSIQDSNFMEAVTRKAELEHIVTSLRSELEIEKSSKDHLKRSIQEDAERKCKMEAERLHEYYNKKVQEIIKTATEEASAAEKSMKDQIRRASFESERRLAECKDRYQSELETLKCKYEAEIEKLKRENLQRQLLISSTVKQLQLGESPNFDVSPLTVQPSKLLQTKKDMLDSLKSQAYQDAGEILYKGNGTSNVARFTLDQLPSSVSMQHQIGSMSKEHFAGQRHNDIPFDSKNAFARYKTSTPIDSPRSAGQHTTLDVNESGDFRRRIKNAGSQSLVKDEKSKPSLEKVCGEKSVHSSCNTSDSLDFKNVLSHILEAPVKPEKEQISSLLSSGKVSDTVADPAILKCIQDFLKGYSDKQNDGGGGGGKTGGSSASSVVSVSVGINNTRDGVNKNEVECSNTSNSDTDRKPCGSISAENSQACQGSCRSGTRKCSKGKIDGSPDQYQSSQIKPPWK